MQYENRPYDTDYAKHLQKVPSINLITELMARELQGPEREHLAHLAAKYPESTITLEEFLLLRWFRDNRHKLGLGELKLMTNTK